MKSTHKITWKEITTGKRKQVSVVGADVADKMAARMERQNPSIRRNIKVVTMPSDDVNRYL